MEIARASKRNRFGGDGGLLADNWWVILLVGIFLVWGITVGPLKGPPRDDSNKPTQAAISTVDLSPTATVTLAPFCDLPGGGRIAVDDVAWLSAGSQIAKFKCGDNGELVKTE